MPLWNMLRHIHYKGPAEGLVTKPTNMKIPKCHNKPRAIDPSEP